MKALTALAIAMIALPAMADSSSCYVISNPDARAYCRAKAQQNSSACYDIQSSDLRAMCLAEVRR